MEVRPHRIINRRKTKKIKVGNLFVGGDSKISVNGVNADKIRSGLLTPSMIQSRSKSRGLNEENYMKGNLLKEEVEAKHVADGFLALANTERTSAHVLTIDGGNIEASLR